MVFYGGLMGSNGVFHRIYPLVNDYITMENQRTSPCLVGKSTISMTIFNGYVQLPEGNYGYISSIISGWWFEPL